MTKRGDQHIIQERPAHEYFTMIPNLYDDSDDTELSVYEFRLLVHYARVGTCWEGLRTTADKCGMSKSQVSRARKKLKDNGWIDIQENAVGTVDVVVRDKWQENTSKYGGPSKDRPSQGQQEQVSPTETQASPPGPEASPPGPKEDLTKKTKEEEEDSVKKISKDQTPLAQAKASIRMEFTNGNMYAQPGEIYDRVFGPLVSAGLTMIDGITEINLTHPDPNIFDDRTIAMLQQALTGVVGGEVGVNIFKADE